MKEKHRRVAQLYGEHLVAEELRAQREENIALHNRLIIYKASLGAQGRVLCSKELHLLQEKGQCKECEG